MKKILFIIFFSYIFISFSDKFLDLGNQEFENKNYKEAIKYYKQSKTDEGNFMTGVSMFEHGSKGYSKKYFERSIKNNYKVSDSYYYLGSIYNYPKFREPDKTSQRANEYFLKALEGEEKGKVYKELGYLQRYTLNSKKAEEYYLKAYENGNYASLCGLLLMYRDLSHRPFSNGYEYRGSEKRVALITDRYNKKLKGFTEDEAREKMDKIKLELRRIKYNCDLLDF